MSCKSEVQHRTTRRAAFTLVELMVVIVIIGMLAGAVTVGVRSYLISGKQSVARMEISKVSQALETFYTQYDRFPSNDEGIEVLAEANEKFAAGLLSKVPTDPWGNRYEYNQPGRNHAFEIISYGADAREGGEGADADITSDEIHQ
ncbi:type II secretion system major pseudopilin GspG [Planctomycetota bacterium]